MKNIGKKLFFILSAFVFVFFMLLYHLFLLFISQQTEYVDSNGKEYSENKHFEVYYLHRIRSAHWDYPDTGRESFMAEFRIIDENITNPVIKNLEYELYYDDVLIPPTTYSLSMHNCSDVIPDYNLLNSRLLVGENTKNPTVYVIIDGLDFYHRNLKLEYNFVVEDASGEYAISGTELLKRKIIKDFDF